MKKILNFSLLIITFALLIVGITTYTNAYFNSTLEGQSEIRSAVWQVEGFNFQKFGHNVNFNRIKPGDSGIINVGAKLNTTLSEDGTEVIFNYNIPEGLGPLEFYLVDNTENQAIKIAELENSGSITLEVEMFMRTNDLEIRWKYPKNAQSGVFGELHFSLVFSQVEGLATYYTDVFAGNLGNFDNVEVTVNKELNTVSFVLINDNDETILTISDVAYVDEGTYLSLAPTDQYPEGIKITNPEVINE